MYQYFPEQNVAVAAVDGRVFLLSRPDSPVKGAFKAVDEQGRDCTETAIKLGLLTLFLSDADAVATGAALLMHESTGEDGLADEEILIAQSGLADPAAVQAQDPVVWIDPAIPADEKWSLIADVVSYKDTVDADPIAVGFLYAALFTRPILSVWQATLEDLLGKSIWTGPAQPNLIRIVSGRAASGESHTFVAGWDDLRDEANLRLGPSGYRSEMDYDSVQQGRLDAAACAASGADEFLEKIRAAR